MIGSVRALIWHKACGNEIVLGGDPSSKTAPYMSNGWPRAREHAIEIAPTLLTATGLLWLDLAGAVVRYFAQRSRLDVGFRDARAPCGVYQCKSVRPKQPKYWYAG